MLRSVLATDPGSFRDLADGELACKIELAQKAQAGWVAKEREPPSGFLEKSLGNHPLSLTPWATV